MANISGPRLQELLSKEARLAELETQQFIAWVGSELGKALAINLALTPMERLDGFSKSSIASSVRAGDSRSTSLY